ncbi:hypothetical protein EVAR_100637_1 [Eumeta japonica]|uniref:DUF5641 domain-containing protein n=1 Tax=Eumeta variegata TaxID=151549 RepID=A0A4C1SLZ3_EUMVA|nr:hypothetical protein EVAR_100637_1 [Eumeta japonica]
MALILRLAKNILKEQFHRIDEARIVKEFDGIKWIFNPPATHGEAWQRLAFADNFWHRWLKEYSPIITRRAKWFGKQTAETLATAVDKYTNIVV